MRSVKPVSDLTAVEKLNFLLTNRVPRRALTRFMGWFSKIENPVIRELSIRVWRACVDDLGLEEAARDRFTSLHDCFTRELKPGARPVDPDPEVITSPCDAVIGQYGTINGLEVIQAKGFPYSIRDLLVDEANAERYRNGRFVTLRLKSSMYHRFHAPCNGHVREILYISGDTWNVNPIALKKIEKLFCRNERAVIDFDTGREGEAITLVPIAAILVASMRLRGIDVPLNLEYRGPNRIPCDLRYAKGDELGYFEHGSTIVLFAQGEFSMADSIATGRTIRMGQPLLVRARNLTDNRE